MITKDQLKLLEQPLQKNEELHYTIGGPVEAAVHSNLESERIGKKNQGHRIMNEAAERFRNNVAFKSREGLTKSQFQRSSDTIPPQDQVLAAETWRQNSVEAHRETLNKARHKLRTAIQEAAQGQAPVIDTDLGYGASAHQTYIDAYMKRHGPQSQPIRDERVKAFAKTMTQGQQRTRDLEQ